MKQEKQQTAVEWLVTELSLKLGYIELSKWDDISNLVEQAKDMEKQQIIDAWRDGLSDNDLTKTVAEKYYKETYGK